MAIRLRNPLLVDSTKSFPVISTFMCLFHFRQFETIQSRVNNFGAISLSIYTIYRSMATWFLSFTFNFLFQFLHVIHFIYTWINPHNKNRKNTFLHFCEIIPRRRREPNNMRRVKSKKFHKDDMDGWWKYCEILNLCDGW